MFYNYLRVALRQMRRHRLTTSINILGLAMALAVVVLVALLIRSELSYDRWLPAADRTYRVNGVFVDEDGREAVTTTPWPLADRLRTEVPEVAAAARVQEVWWGETLLEHGTDRRYVDQAARVDTAFFTVFALPFRYGSARSAWATPDHAVLSRRLAEALFGPIDPVGQIVRVQANRNYVVGAVLDDLPPETHFDFALYLPLTTPRNGATTWDGMFNYRTYVQLRPGADPAAFEAKVNDLLAEQLHRQLAAAGRTEALAELAANGPGVAAQVQPLTTLHTQPLDAEDSLKPPAQHQLLYGLGAVALIMLLIALINFMNLATAHAAGRAKEVGVRKVVGASRGVTAVQFFVESTLQVALAYGLGLALAAWGLPRFNALLTAELAFLPALPWLLGWGLPLVLLTGLAAGSYPAVFLSRFRPVRVLKGDYHSGADGVRLRRLLVVGQFLCCGVMLLFLFNVNAQVQYMLAKDLGFRAEQVVRLPIRKQETKERFATLRHELRQIPGVQDVSLAERLPGDDLGNTAFSVNQHEEILDFLLVDHRFAATLDLTLTRGQFLTAAMAADTVPQYVVNEAFLQAYGITDDPIGQILNADQPRWAGPIVGVVANFHWRGFTETIRPIVLREYDAWLAQAAVRIDTRNAPATLAAIEAVLGRFEPEYLPQFRFLDELFARYYQRYLAFGVALRYLSGIVLLIALLGLFGLAAYLTERRQKEIGIRKLLGASTAGLSALLVRDFSRSVLLAGLLALPLGWYLSEYWLRDFSYRIEQRAWVFVAALAFLLVVAVATVASHVVRAALRNPAESLRRE
jgi:putative ABC transport system permease protein